MIIQVSYQRKKYNAEPTKYISKKQWRKSGEQNFKRIELKCH